MAFSNQIFTNMITHCSVIIIYTISVKNRWIHDPANRNEWNVLRVHQLNSLIIRCWTHDNCPIDWVTRQERGLNLLQRNHIKQHPISIIRGFEYDPIDKLRMKCAKKKLPCGIVNPIVIVLFVTKLRAI